MLGETHVTAGGVNVARWAPEKEWRPDVLALLRDFNLQPVPEYPADCCFIGMGKGLVNKFRITGTSWGEGGGS